MLSDYLYYAIFYVFGFLLISHMVMYDLNRGELSKAQAKVAIIMVALFWPISLPVLLIIFVVILVFGLIANIAIGIYDLFFGG